MHDAVEAPPASLDSRLDPRPPTKERLHHRRAAERRREHFPQERPGGEKGVALRR